MLKWQHYAHLRRWFLFLDSMDFFFTSVLPAQFIMHAVTVVQECAGLNPDARHTSKPGALLPERAKTNFSVHRRVFLPGSPEIRRARNKGFYV